jgi:hypothetical protein
MYYKYFKYYKYLVYAARKNWKLVLRLFWSLAEVQKVKYIIILWWKVLCCCHLPSTQLIHITPLENHCHNSKNTTFQERGKTAGRGDAVTSKEWRHFSPLTAILENRRVTLFYKVDMVSDIPSVGITQNERFLSCDTVLLGVRYVCPV